ncbi:sigma-54-dependent Fis family transcriptional regulator [Candidatus Parcubacteria bacterium]|nr:MAG: sigma-54-dependent Fis family transcriptional regulator [Candidatus Parcubacteria bacterium]
MVTPSATAPLCKRCGIRPATYRRFGSCNACRSAFYAHETRLRTANLPLISFEEFCRQHPWRASRRPAPAAVIPPAAAFPAFAEDPELVPGFLLFSPIMQRLAADIRKVAATDASILITGASGVGKELVARAFHRLSDRKNKPFIPVNCGLLAPELAESLLFGHVRGAFTGAVRESSGLFLAANGGTVLLDEIGDLPFGLQIKLLRFLDDQVIWRVGGVESRVVNVRILAATNRDLPALVKRGLFRADLFHRLTVIRIHVPRLAERVDDIAGLATRFLQAAAPEKKFSADAIRAMEAYAWPGNVRELKHLVTRIRHLFPGDTVSERDIQYYLAQGSAWESTAEDPEPTDVAPASAPLPSSLIQLSWTELKRRTTEEQRIKLVRDLWVECRGNRREVAKKLKITYKTAFRLLALAGLRQHPE